MRILIICGLAALQLAGQENSWKTEIDNSLVGVERRIVAPRETVAVAEMHSALLVFLTDYSVRLATASPPEEAQGKLDLVVCSYADYASRSRRICANPELKRTYFCDPRLFKPFSAIRSSFDARWLLLSYPERSTIWRGRHARLAGFSAGRHDQGRASPPQAHSPCLPGRRGT